MKSIPLAVYAAIALFLEGIYLGFIYWQARGTFATDNQIGLYLVVVLFYFIQIATTIKVIRYLKKDITARRNLILFSTSIIWYPALVVLAAIVLPELYSQILIPAYPILFTVGNCLSLHQMRD